MIWLILIFALVLRVINLNQSLWLDEAINVLASQNFSFWDFVTKYPVGDFHPPAFFAILWIWTKIGGIGEIWVRLPSIIFGVATVWIVFLLGKDIFSKRIGYLAALFLSVAPLHVYYSQEARMYSLATFVVTLSMYYFWRVINNGNKGEIVGYMISNILVLYSDYLAYLIFPVQLLYLMVWERKSLTKLVFPWVVNLISILPWLTIFPRQLSSGTSAAASLPGWATVVGGASLKELLLIPVKTFFGRISVENKQIYGLVSGVIGLLYGALILNGTRKLNRGVKLLMLWLFIPIILAFAISFLIPVLSYFRMLFILPAIYLLLAKGIDSISSSIQKSLIFVICFISLISLGIYYTNPKFQREDWRGAINQVDYLAQNGVIIFENNNLPAPFIYYSKNLSPAISGLNQVPVNNESNVVINTTKDIYLFEYLVDITDPKRLLEKNIEKKGFKKIETLNFSGVGFVFHYRLQY